VPTRQPGKQYWAAIILAIAGVLGALLVVGLIASVSIEVRLTQSGMTHKVQGIGNGVNLTLQSVSTSTDPCTTTTKLGVYTINPSDGTHQFAPCAP
jgi:hypothetical protein